MNIYVGNLAREATESDLRDAFQAFGEVSSAAIIKDKFSGESRGFGFVEMPNKAEAEKAISSLNGKSLKGRNLTVNEARPRTDNRGGGGFGGGGSRRY
jgi:RNA recognition motif-containing protein